jgi:hypothetical protein
LKAHAGIVARDTPTTGIPGKLNRKTAVYLRRTVYTMRAQKSDLLTTAGKLTRISQGWQEEK